MAEPLHLDIFTGTSELGEAALREICLACNATCRSQAGTSTWLCLCLGIVVVKGRGMRMQGRLRRADGQSINWIGEVKTMSALMVDAFRFDGGHTDPRLASIPAGAQSVACGTGRRDRE